MVTCEKLLRQALELIDSIPKTSELDKLYELVDGALIEHLTTLDELKRLESDYKYLKDLR